jgi:hypothetical protein
MNSNKNYCNYSQVISPGTIMWNQRRNEEYRAVSANNSIANLNNFGNSNS